MQSKRRWPRGTWMRLKSGSLLREMMNTRQASNADVALAAGCGRTFISALVNGRRNSCTPIVAERIALYFGVPLGLLFEVKTSADSGHVVPTQRKAS